MNNWVNALFPFACYAGMTLLTGSVFATQFKHKMTASRSKAVNLGLTVFAWWGWYNYNPLYKSVLREKERLLWKIFDSIGYEVIQLNEMIPRTWTEEYIHMLMRRLHRERSGSQAGMFTPTQETGGYVGDRSKIPLKNNPYKVQF